MLFLRCYKFKLFYHWITSKVYLIHQLICQRKLFSFMLDCVKHFCTNLTSKLFPFFSSGMLHLIVRILYLSQSEYEALINSQKIFNISLLTYFSFHSIFFGRIFLKWNINPPTWQACQKKCKKGEMSLISDFFFLMWSPIVRRHLFWAPSMVYISVISYTYYTLQFTITIFFYCYRQGTYYKPEDPAF